MRFGLSIPNFGIFGDPHVLTRLARTAETAGWDGFFVWDHIQIGHWAGPVVDPWVSLTAAAAATERMLIGPMVTPLPRRRPSKLARETVTLDHFSGGRLVLGVGIGWPPDIDFANFGDALENRTRGEQLDEGLHVLTSLWSGETIDHEGRHYTVRNARFLPQPLQKPRIPIWVGGMWPFKPAFRRAASWDGVFPFKVGDDYDFAPLTPEDLAAVLAYTFEHRESDDPFEVVAGGALGEIDVSAFGDAGATWLLDGIGWPEQPLEAWTEHIAAGPPR
jgi:alkanesulfonate monooxygenase SsuD/methylene tetrahydromethanopterin reductase-like flavin-dependent oxidoreductase (luciferase family)